jgi:dynein heavy chain
VLTDEELRERVGLLKDSATRTAFGVVNRGLFERDKLTFAVQLALRLGMDAGELPVGLVQALLVGPVFNGDPGPRGSGLEEWLPEPVWPKVRALERTAGDAVFEKLGAEMAGAPGKWRAWFDHETPETAPPPGEYGRTCTPLHTLLLLRAMRPDRLPAALRSFVAARLGGHFVSPPAWNLAAAVEESTPATPLLFVLFPGVDPTREVEAYAAAQGLTAANGGFVNISMGQGQEAGAATAMKEAAARGGWLFLQNVHLMQSW